MIAAGVTLPLALAAGTALGGLLAIGAILCSGAYTVLSRKVSRPEDDELVVWVWFARAALCATAGFGLDAAVQVAVVQGTVSAHGAGVGLALPLAAASSALYQGLIRWNRIRTLVSDPGDWLNGISAVTALMALANLLVTSSGSELAALPWWQLQVWLLQGSGLVVLLGTAGTVLGLGGLERDARALLIVAGLGTAVVAQCAAAIVGPVAVLGVGSQSLSLLAVLTTGSWVLVMLAVAVASWGPRAQGTRAREATSVSTTTGALVVLLASVAILIAHDLIAHDVSDRGQFHLVPVLAALSALTGAIRMLRQVRQLSEVAQSRAEARTDDLTGIANRRRLVEIVNAAARDSTAITLVVIDLDRFKDVNDRHGHVAGDALLRAMAQRLQSMVGARGTLARLGGDEFALMMDSGPAKEAAEVAEELLAAIREPIEVFGRNLRVNASIGIASTLLSGHGDGELMRCADVALYAAKRAGGGVSTYDEAADVHARGERLLLEELRATLTTAPDEDGDGITVHYQPQLRVGSGLVVGIEALVRWQHPRLGLLSPVDFLDLAERHDLMGLLTRRVMELATREAAGWRAHGPDLRLAVNLSTSSLTDPGLLGMIDESLARNDLPADRLVMEITETSLMQDSDLAIAVTREIAARGIGISIDDFGTGYSSLAYLNDLPAEELKLDRTFTSRLTADRRTAAIVSGTVDLAHHLGLRLVAEGVEDLETLAALSALGCDVTQGYLHSRPLPAAGMTVWLDQSRGSAAPRSGSESEV